MANRPSVSRRNFVRTAIATLAAATWLKPRNLYADKKPALTDDAFNRHFERVHATPHFGAELEQAKRDFGRYLAAHFDLTRQQIDNINSLPAANVREIRTALDRAAAAKLPIKLAGVSANQQCARVKPD